MDSLKKSNFLKTIFKSKTFVECYDLRLFSTFSEGNRVSGLE